MLDKIHQFLIAGKKSLALAESCTGGALAARFVSLSGASNYLLGSLVVYSNVWKHQFLGVSLEVEPVSRKAVKQMLEGLFARTSADYAIATSGHLDPPGDVYVGVAQRGGFLDVQVMKAPPRRGEGIELAVQAALALFWKRIST